MTGRWVRAVTIVTGLATMSAACSGSDGPEPAAPLESAEPITAPPPTDAAASTSTTTATTTAPVDTTTPSEPSISTTPIATTTEPTPSTTTLDDLRAEIEADLNEGEQALINGGAAPGDPVSVEALQLYYAGASLQALTAAYAELERQGHVVAPGEVPSSNVVVEVLEVGDGSATIQRCRIDAARVVRGGDENEAINTNIVRYTTIDQIIREDERWKLNGGETLTREVGERTCDS